MSLLNPVKLNRSQRKSLAKYSYDVSKIALSGLAIGSLIEKTVLSYSLIISGLLATILFLVLGMLLERKSKQKIKSNKD
jgi:ABC-type Mn2+/Zn2+ transport system permease subunit